MSENTCHHSPCPAEPERLAVLGLGYVGLPLALAATKAGWAVTGFDTSEARTAELTAGSPGGVPCEESLLNECMEQGLKFSSDPASLIGSQMFVICVPTPLDRYSRPDLSMLESAAGLIAARISRGAMVILESTSWPGTTREVVAPILGKSGLDPLVDIDIAFAPEREDPGNAQFVFGRIPRLVGGLTARATERAVAFYRSFTASVTAVSSPEVAEAAKLLENTFRAVNIALVNEMKMVLTRMDIDINEVVDAAATKPFGFMPFRPGPGAGGHCIPVDPLYLAWRAEQMGIPARFIRLAGSVNRLTPRWVALRTADALRERGIPIKGAKVLVLGIAYKRDIPDLRETPAIPIIRTLRKLGAKVRWADPVVTGRGNAPRRGPLALGCVELSDEELAIADCVLVVTDHSSLDKQRIYERARLIVDTRGFYRTDPDGKVVTA